MAVARKICCRVTEIRSCGDHVYSVALSPGGQIPRFKAGQFLHLAIDPYDPSGFWPESRIFSIASSPSNRDALTISYSVRGKYTARMERELAEGMDVWVKMPYGEFVIDEKHDSVLIAGGTGITAFTAFIDGLDPGFVHSIHLVYGVRRRELLLYHDMIHDKMKTAPNLKTTYFVEDENTIAENIEFGPRMNQKKGIISVDAVWPEIDNPKEKIFYISGPPSMLTSISDDLFSRGIDKKAVRIDAWE